LHLIQVPSAGFEVAAEKIPILVYHLSLLDAPVVPQAHLIGAFSLSAQAAPRKLATNSSSRFRV